MNNKNILRLEKILVISIIVLMILSVSTFILCHCSDNSDGLYQYSHHITIELTSNKTSLENWHQALIDSTFSETDWNYRYFRPIVSVNIDTVRVGYQVELDSLTQCLSKIDQLYKEYYNDALSDLRQESNNIINKWSAWFSFWLSLLALLIGIVPLVLQFKMSGKNRELLKKEVIQLKKEIRDTEAELTTSVSVR